jgi:hypothetical protein
VVVADFVIAVELPGGPAAPPFIHPG